MHGLGVGYEISASVTGSIVWANGLSLNRFDPVLKIFNSWSEKLLRSNGAVVAERDYKGSKVVNVTTSLECNVRCKNDYVHFMKLLIECSSYFVRFSSSLSTI